MYRYIYGPKGRAADLYRHRQKLACSDDHATVASHTTPSFGLPAPSPSGRGSPDYWPLGSRSTDLPAQGDKVVSIIFALKYSAEMLLALLERLTKRSLAGETTR